MGTALMTTEAIPLSEAIARANEYIAHSKAGNTLRAYRADWQHFMSWCDAQGVESLPATAETVGGYLAELATSGLKVSTIQRRLSAISQAHELKGYDSPTKERTVRTVMQGIRRVHGTAQKGKTPAVTNDVRQMVESLPDSLLGVRDRVMLLVGFAGAFRRSELVGLDVSDLEFTPEGVRITLGHSKTDQEGQGRVVGIPYASPAMCPVRSLEAWLGKSGITEGPIFRSVNRHGKMLPSRLTAQVVAHVVKRTAEKVGLDPTRYAGHSLRSGHATAAAKAGVSERVIMNQTGHRSVNMVRKYIRNASVFHENSAARLGL